MRDIVLTLFILGVLPYVFKRPWLGVLLWTWLSVMNPHRLTYGFAAGAPFAQLAAGATFISLFVARKQLAMPKRPVVWVLILFIVWMVITTFTAFYVEDSNGFLGRVIKIQLMTLVALAALHELRHIRWFMWVNAVSIAFFGVKGGFFTLTSGGGGRVLGPGGFLSDNNATGLAMVITVPMLYYLFATSTNRRVRMGLMFTMVLTFVAVLGTYSRGAFLAISSMLVLLWWRAKGRRIVSAVALLVVVVAILPVMPQAWFDRMNTVKTYEQDGSAMHRIHSWLRAINIANHHITGAGFSAYTPEIEAIYGPPPDDPSKPPAQLVVAHSIYFQVLGEHGWIGLALFLGIWTLALYEGNVVRKMTQGRPELREAYELAGACQISLFGFFVGGAFLSMAYFDVPYNMMVTIVVLRRWVERQLAASKKSPGYGSASGKVQRLPQGKPGW